MQNTTIFHNLFGGVSAYRKLPDVAPNYADPMQLYHPSQYPFSLMKGSDQGEEYFILRIVHTTQKERKIEVVKIKNVCGVLTVHPGYNNRYNRDGTFIKDEDKGFFNVQNPYDHFSQCKDIRDSNDERYQRIQQLILTGQSGEYAIATTEDVKQLN